MRPRRPVVSAVIHACILVGAAWVHAETAPPLELRLQFSATALHWEMTAREDVQILDSRVRSLPATLGANSLSLPAALTAGATRAGTLSLGAVPQGAWMELRLRLGTRNGEVWLGASTRAAAASSQSVRAGKASAGEPGFLTARCLYEDRLQGPDGYTGATQELPLRYVDTALVGDDGTLLATASLRADGTVRLPIPAGSAGRARLRLWSSARLPGRFDLAVLDPSEAAGRTRFRRHELESAAVAVDAAGVDLGTLVFRDPDGFGPLQAFHVLDVAVDAWDALADPAFAGAAPTDSLRFLWGPSARLRVTAFSGHSIQLVAPGSGDTDGWSDAVILHEIGHFVARLLLRDDSRGGVHLLGDVEQDLSLAYSEGFATAFACMVRAWRATARRNVAGFAADAQVSLYIDAGMPPPDGVAGGLGFAWDLETHHWVDGTALLRDGLGSESNVAATLWDLADHAATADASPGTDDDAGSVATSRLWLALRALRDLPATRRVTLEDFWLVASGLFDAGETRLLQRVFIEQARIPFVADSLEPDDDADGVPHLGVGYPARVPGGLVIDEIDPGATAAVEITNRSNAWAELGGWSLLARRNGTSTNPGLTYRFPPETRLAPGARLVVHRGGHSEDSTPVDLFTPSWTAPWFPVSDGALVLVNAAGLAVDFVRWDGKDGTASATLVPEETGFAGRLQAPGYGRTLARRSEVDRDEATDFVAAVPSLGLPNDAQVWERTFFPVGDVDALRLVASRAGLYTLQISRPRNGAEPFLELHGPGRPRLVPRAARPDGGQRLTLWLRSGEEVWGTIRHLGSQTRYGTYTLAAYAEPESRQLLPPEGLEVRFAPDAAAWELQVSWWNAALYDSLQLRIDGNVVARTRGDARRVHSQVPDGEHALQLVAFVLGHGVSAPRLDVQVAPLPLQATEDFDGGETNAWELQGGWGLAAAPGRDGQALTDSPSGDYEVQRRQSARWRTAVLVEPGATLCFDHICIVRPEDKATVEVSDDWGARWTILGRWSLESRHGRDGEADWSDRHADPQDWVHECLSLDAYVGRPVQMRLRLETDLYGGAEGWTIDALKLGVHVPASTAPRLHLGPALPNPFNPRTRIEYEIPTRGMVLLRVLDVRGRLVRMLVQGSQPAGAQHAFWNGDGTDGRPVGSGVYFVQLQSDGQRRSTKIVLLR